MLSVTATSLDEYPARSPNEELGDISERDCRVELRLADAHGARELGGESGEDPFIGGWDKEGS